MTTTQQALFFTFIGEEVGSFAEELSKRGFEIIVVNCDDTHDCLSKCNVNHVFRTDAENGDVLVKFRKDMALNKLSTGVVVMDCENSMTTVGYEANMELRWASTLAHFIL